MEPILFILSFEQYDIGSNPILVTFLVALGFVILYFAFKMFELGYVMRYKKPFYNHFYFRLKTLKPDQIGVLRQQFPFFSKLTGKEQQHFEHRVASFIADKTFIGREGLQITAEVEILIAATGVMLTFGFRDYYIGLIDKIFVYPSTFYSNANQAHHKGEFNPRLKALVLSWEHFKLGYAIGDDNLNLGIHEFAHAIHLNSIKERDVSSIIFRDSFRELTGLLSANETLRKELITSKYFRAYAYTNQFEFLAVLVEYFIESPQEFKSQFPNVYAKVKQMLNFKFSGY